jgi:hypothetical protein
MPNYVEEFAILLGWDVDSSGLDDAREQVADFKDRVKDLGDILKKAALGMAAFVTGTIAFTAIESKAVRETVNLAKAVGLSTDALEAWGSVAGGIGLEMDNVIDLAEEMNNKIGEMEALGELITLQEGLQLLGLEYENIRNLAPEKQFEMILSTAKELANEQQAVSAVDMIFGGEANKILGHLRSYDESLGDILDRYKELNLQTDESREGAISFAESWAGLMTMFGSLRKTLAGFLGEALTPLLDEVKELVVANKDLIRTKLKEWAQTIANTFRAIVTQGRRAIGTLNRVIKAFGGWKNAAKALGIAFVGLKLGALIGSFMTMIAAAGGLSAVMGGLTARGGALNLLLKNFGIGLAVIAALLVAEDLYFYFTGGESAIGDAAVALEKFLNQLRDTTAEFLGLDPGRLDQLIEKFKVLAEVLWNPFVILERIRELLKPGEGTIFDVVLDSVQRMAGLFSPVKMTLDLVKRGVGELRAGRAQALAPAAMPAQVPGMPLLAPPAGANQGTVQPVVAGPSQVRNEVKQTNNIRIFQKPGEDPIKFKNRVVKAMEGIMDDAVHDIDAGLVR